MLATIRSDNKRSNVCYEGKPLATENDRNKRETSAIKTATMATIDDDGLVGMLGRIHITENVKPVLNHWRRGGGGGGGGQPRLVTKGPPPPPARGPSGLSELDKIHALRSDWNVRGPPRLTEAMLEKQLRACVADRTSCRSPSCCFGDTEASECSERDESHAISTASAAAPVSLATSGPHNDTQYHRVAQRYGLQKVKELNSRQLSNGSLSDLLHANLKSANEHGQTTLMVFVSQQNLEGVRYCCLFMCSGDESLFPALAEAALLPSDEIFCAILEKVHQNSDESAATRQPLGDRPVQGWQFLNRQLQQYRGRTLEQLLRHSNQIARLNALRRATGTGRSSC